jgi:hypothetical protein
MPFYGYMENGTLKQLYKRGIGFYEYHLARTHPERHQYLVSPNHQILGIGNRCQIPYSKDRLLIDFMTFHFRLFWRSRSVSERESLYAQVGGIDASLPCATDYDLCLKLSEVNEIRHLPQSLYDYRSHSQSISQAQRNLQAACAQRVVQDAIERQGLSDRYTLPAIATRFQRSPSGNAQFKLMSVPIKTQFQNHSHSLYLSFI